MSRGHKYIFKVIVVGDAAVGKTSLMFRFVHGSFQSDYKMTIGVNFATKMAKNHNSFEGFYRIMLQEDAFF